MERCEDCGRRFDRPAGKSCDSPGDHAEPDLAQKIVAAIEEDLSDRRGLKREWERTDPGTQDEARDRWAELVREQLREAGEA